MRSIGGLGAAGAAVVVVVYGVAAFCGCQTVPVEQPGVDGLAGGVVAIVEDLYLAEGRGRILFIGSDQDVQDLLEDAQLAAAKETLAKRLAVKVLDASEACHDNLNLAVLTPVDCQSGEVGITIHLGPVMAIDDDTYVLVAAFARSGLDGAVYPYTLRLTDAGWLIAGAQLVGAA